jgi:hypothetical protein
MKRWLYRLLWRPLLQRPSTGGTTASNLGLQVNGGSPLPISAEKGNL